MFRKISLIIVFAALITTIIGFANLVNGSNSARGLVVQVNRSSGSLVSGAVVEIYQSGILVLGPKTTNCTGKVTWGQGDPIPPGGVTLTCKVMYCGATFYQDFISPGSSTIVYMNVGNPRCANECPDE